MNSNTSSSSMDSFDPFHVKRNHTIKEMDAVEMISIYM